MRAAAFLLQAPLALMVLYLDGLSLAALLWRRTPRAAAPRARFAVLVPAHDEETTLPRLLASLDALDYPRALYAVHVVADNCSDRTATLAAGAGATVYERRDERLRGKGYALRWLLQQLQKRGVEADAYVILDADSVVAPAFLAALNAHLAQGAQAIQGYYGVLNAEASWSSALRYAALALFNDLRPRGRDALGLSAGLRGNGMCFARDVVARFGWEAFTLAEDVEFHLTLVAAGIRVRYAPDACVLAEMPTSLRQARSQNVRWERGRLQLLRSFGPRLVALGLRRRDPALLDAVAEQLVPPLSILSGLAVLSFVLTGAARARGPRRLAALVLLGQLAYVLTGLRLVRAAPRIYLTLLGAPFYIVWKLWVYALAAAGLGDSRWVRTARSRRVVR